MLIKIMSNEDIADDNSSKDCLIVSGVTSVKYHKNIPTTEAILTLSYEKPIEGLVKEDFVLNGNAYLMNDNGKTIQSFYPMPTYSYQS